MVESISLTILILIAGLGLGGASSYECSQALQSAGYSFTDSQVDVIAGYANDPSVINYINENHTALCTAYNSGNFDSSGGMVETVTYLDQFKEEHPYLATGVVALDGLVPVNILDLCGFNEVVEVKVGDQKKIISDGHGGVFYWDTFVGDRNCMCIYAYYRSSDGREINLGGWVCGQPGHVLSGYFTFAPDSESDYVRVQFHSFDINADVPYTRDEKEYRIYLGNPADDIDEFDVEQLFISEDGTITDADGNIIDGSLPDGRPVILNPDGTITVGEDILTPSIDLSDLTNDDVLSDVLDKIADLTSELTFEDTAEDEEELEDLLEEAAEEADEAAAGYQGDLSEFKAPSGIAGVFPFCIPFDFVRGVKLLSAQPVAPNFDIPFEIPAIGAYPGTKTVIKLNFTQYDRYFVIIRWGTTVIFLMGLCFISTKIVKGAGA